MTNSFGQNSGEDSKGTEKGGILRPLLGFFKKNFSSMLVSLVISSLLTSISIYYTYLQTSLSTSSKITDFWKDIQSTDIQVHKDNAYLTTQLNTYVNMLGRLQTFLNNETFVGNKKQCAKVLSDFKKSHEIGDRVVAAEERLHDEYIYTSITEGPAAATLSIKGWDSFTQEKTAAWGFKFGIELSILNFDIQSPISQGFCAHNSLSEGDRVQVNSILRNILTDLSKTLYSLRSQTGDPVVGAFKKLKAANQY